MANHKLLYKVTKAQKPYQVFCTRCPLYLRLGLATFFSIQGQLSTYFEALAGDCEAL